MTLTANELRFLAERAAHAARKAGEVIRGARPTTVHRKMTGDHLASQVVTDVDRRAEDIILQTLAPSVGRFDLGVLSEESPDTGSRLSKDYFWCIDPLDGTLPFIEGKPGYSVSIALVSRDGTPMIGVVFDPVGCDLYVATRGQGLTRNNIPWAPRAEKPEPLLSVFFDRSFQDSSDFELVTVALRRFARSMGLEGVEVHTKAGAVMNACQVLCGPPACYFKYPKPQPGGGSLWDFAATACLFHEAGCVATDIGGKPLDLNRPDSTFMNHRGALFATSPELANRIRSINLP